MATKYEGASIFDGGELKATSSKGANRLVDDCSAPTVTEKEVR